MSAFKKRTIGFAAATMLVGVAPAHAQVEQPPRASHGLFGGPPRSPDSNQEFDASLSAFNSFDSDPQLQSDPSGPVAGHYSGLIPGLSYSRRDRVFDFGVNGGANMRYYPATQDFANVSDSVGATVSFHGQHRSLSIGGFGGYQPFYSFVPFSVAPDPGQAPVPPAVDTALLRQTSVTYGTTVSAHQDLSARMSLSGSFAFNDRQFSDNSVQQSGLLGGASLSYHVTKDAAIRGGYTYQDTSYTDPLTAGHPQTTGRAQGIDAGLDYSKALGQTRRTTISFSSGSVVLQQSGVSRFEVTGTASFNRQIGRTWAAHLNYNRGMSVLDGFKQPAFTNSFAASVGGQLNRRFDLQAAWTATQGYVGFAVPDNNFTNDSGSTRLRYAFSEKVAAYVQYVGYRYHFDTVTDLPSGLGTKATRQTVQGGITVFVPLFR